MSDLIERLRTFKNARIVMDTNAEHLCNEAADELDLLRAGIDKEYRLRIGYEEELERKDKVIERLRANIDAMNCNRDHIYPLTLADHVRTIAELRAEIERLEDALKEISKGEGRFSMDRQKHANNTIEDMIGLAKAALDRGVR